MRIRSLLSGFTCFAVVAVCCATAGAQAKDEKKPGDKPAPTAQPPAAKPADKPAGDKPALSAEHQAEMEAWMKAATPGPEHAKLKAVEGNWTTVTKSWHDPAGPPEESKGTREAKWIFDGRFLEERYTGSFMGTPFQGLGLAGYDNVSKKYVTAWLDNFGTGILLFTGTADAAGKSFTYTAEFTDVMTGKMTKMRTVTRIVDDKTFVFEMYGPGKDGKEFKMMEITHTKKS